MHASIGGVSGSFRFFDSKHGGLGFGGTGYHPKCLDGDLIGNCIIAWPGWPSRYGVFVFSICIISCGNI